MGREYPLKSENVRSGRVWRVWQGMVGYGRVYEGLGGFWRVWANLREVWGVGHDSTQKCTNFLHQPVASTRLTVVYFVNYPLFYLFVDERR